MLYRIHNTVILGLLTVFSLTGCYYDEGRDVTVDMGIEKLDVLSISEDRPAKVLIGVVGSHSNTCVDVNAKVYAKRQGNSIQLRATMDICEGCTCGDAITETYGEVTVENLEVGEYRIMSGDRELLKFRIEADAGYVTKKPIINFITISVKTAEGDEWHGFPKGSSDPVQVTLNVSGYFGSECEPFLKTHIEQDIQNFSGRLGGDFNIDISGEVPINANCLSSINPYEIYTNEPYNAQIDLGKVLPGHYFVTVNGRKTWLTER